MSLTGTPASVTVWDRRPASTLDAFQLIAEGVTAVGGFGVAAISVVRGDHLVVVALSGSAEAREQLLGTRTTISELLDEIANADDWGRFRFLPHERIAPGTGNLGWVPEIEPLDGADAWHPLDLLVAPLVDADGGMVGMLSIDMPVDGRRPGPEQRRILDAYAEQASRAVLTALEGEVLAEQVRLADAAREIVRNISTELSMDALLEACNEAVVDGFGAVGLWIQTFDSLGGPGSGRIWVPEGIEISVPEKVRTIAEFAAHDTWNRQTVDIVRVGSPRSLLPDRERDIVYTYLSEIDVASMLFVPLGAGQECVGALSLTRGPDHPHWSPVEVSAARDIGRDIGRAVLNARTYERERELVAELQALDTYKSQLISTLSHELKNPLTAISGHLELLEQVETETQTRRSLEAIDRGSQRLSRIVDDLMMLAKVGDPMTPLIATPVDLVGIVDEVLDMLSVSATSRGIELTSSHPGVPTRVLGDATEIDRLVANLVGNAVKYTESNGTVTVSLLPGDDEVVLEVVDTGIGISAEDQEQLFTEFFRSSNPVAVAQPGTGLGLPIVSRIVARHGGRLHLASSLGVGSTFRVVLPVDQPTVQQ